MPSEALRRRVEALQQRHIDSRPMRPNTVCFAEGGESAAATFARLNIDPESFDTLVRITPADSSTPRPDDSP